MKCEICGKGYRRNTSPFLEQMPKAVRAKLEFIPACSCYEELKAQEEQERERERVKQNIMNRQKPFQDISIADDRFLAATFDADDTDMSSPVMNLAKTYAERFVKKGEADVGMLFHGPVGTGKTYATACMSNYVTQAGMTTMALSLGLYINRLQREWAEAESEVLELVKKCDLLILDDFGVEKATDFVRDKVFMLIDTRYRANKAMLVTTNLVLKNEGLSERQIAAQLSIESKFGSRISDRLAQMCQVCAVMGKSRRGDDTKSKFLEFLRG